MRYTLIGDLHGTDLSKLENALGPENADVLVCTGDFDQTRTIHQFMELEQKYLKAGKSVIKVPGNHDHALLTGLEINSGAIRRQNTNFDELYDELLEDSEAWSYITRLVKSSDPRVTNNHVKTFLDKQRFGEEFQTVVMHGAYDGNLTSLRFCPPDVKNLWYRLRIEEDHRKNFEVMKQKGYRAMIRGHDHYPEYAYQDSSGRIVSDRPGESEAEYVLSKDKMHTINPGALLNGHFATIDTEISSKEVPILKYHLL
jgi:predicted phosphodiesterase